MIIKKKTFFIESIFRIIFIKRCCPYFRSTTVKIYFKIFYAPDQAELRPNPCRTRYPAGPWCTQLQILDLPCLELDPLIFHNFLNFHQPKVYFVTRRSLKKSRILPYEKRFQKNKGAKGSNDRGEVLFAWLFAIHARN